MNNMFYDPVHSLSLSLSFMRRIIALNEWTFGACLEAFVSIAGGVSLMGIIRPMRLMASVNATGESC